METYTKYFFIYLSLTTMQILKEACIIIVNCYRVKKKMDCKRSGKRLFLCARNVWVVHLFSSHQLG